MSESKQLSFADISNADDSKIEKVEVPEWGGHIYVKRLDNGEHTKPLIRLQEKIRTDTGYFVDYQIKMLAACCCDDKGKAIFGSDQAEQLRIKSFAVVNRLFLAAAKLNGMDTEAQAEVKND